MDRLTCLLDFDGPIHYPTTLGGTLRFTDHKDFWTRCEVALSLFECLDSDGPPDDILQAQIWVADAEGVVWTASHRFYAMSLFWQVFLSADYSKRRLSEAEESKAEYLYPYVATDGKSIFETHMVLEDVRCFTDARGYYYFAVQQPSNEWEVEQFRPKYLSVAYDVAAHPPSGTPETQEWLAFRFRAWHQFEDENYPIACSYVYIPTLIAIPGCHYVEGKGYLVEELPQPISLIFEPTEERGTPIPGMCAFSAEESVRGQRT